MAYDERACKRAYYQAHKDEIKARTKKWAAENRDRVNESTRKRRQSPEVREKRKLERQKYYATHKKRIRAERSTPEWKAYIRAYNVAYYAENRDEGRAAAKAWREAHLDHARRKSRAWRAKHPEQVRINYERCYARSKDKYVERAMRRKAMLLGVTIGDPVEIRAYYHWVRTTKCILCHWCNKRIPKGQRSVDHYIPLSRGGAHGLQNFVPACLKCNLSKNDKLPHEFTGQHELFPPQHTPAPTAAKNVGQSENGVSARAEAGEAKR